MDHNNIFDLYLANNQYLSKIMLFQLINYKLFLDKTKLIIGKDLATTPGKVILKNKLMELICYYPNTKTVYTSPILLVPACINKYYILDLSPHNSLVKWLTKQGFIVYIISWINPQPGSAACNFSFKDYVLNGIIKAIDIITSIPNINKLHVAGYCLGGTLLNCALAYLLQLGDQRILSLTNFMTLLNFDNLPTLNMLLTKSMLKFTRDLLKQQGFLDGKLLAIFFSYLQSQNFRADPNTSPRLSNLLNIDLSFWNNDPLNLPGKMYSYYLNNFCVHNKLARPNSLRLNKIPLDLRKIKLPIFTVAGSKDHITAWQAVYQGARLYCTPVEFILANAGHVKSIIAPPTTTQSKYTFQINPHQQILPFDPASWIQQAQTNLGSWWPYWLNWLQQLDNHHTINLGINGLMFGHNLADAPGSYVYQQFIHANA